MSGTQVTQVFIDHQTYTVSGSGSYNIAAGNDGPATVIANQGTVTVAGGISALTVNASGNPNPVLVEAGNGLLTFTPGSSPNSEVIAVGNGQVSILAGDAGGSVSFRSGAGAATVAGAAGDNVTDAGTGAITVVQHGTMTVEAGLGAISVIADGSELTVLGADGDEEIGIAPASGNVLSITTNATNDISTVTDAAGLQVTLGDGNGDQVTSVTGGSGNVTLAQTNATTVRAGSGVITIASDPGGSPLTLEGADGLEQIAWWGTAGDILTLNTAHGATTVSDNGAPVAVLGGGHVTYFINVSANGFVSDRGGLRPHRAQQLQCQRNRQPRHGHRRRRVRAGLGCRHRRC